MAGYFFYVDTCQTGGGELSGEVRQIGFFHSYSEAQEFATTARTAIRQHPKAFKSWVRLMLHAPPENITKRGGSNYE